MILIYKVFGIWTDNNKPEPHQVKVYFIFWYCLLLTFYRRLELYYIGSYMSPIEGIACWQSSLILQLVKTYIYLLPLLLFVCAYILVNIPFFILQAKFLRKHNKCISVFFHRILLKLFYRSPNIIFKFNFFSGNNRGDASFLLICSFLAWRVFFA